MIKYLSGLDGQNIAALNVELQLLYHDDCCSSRVDSPISSTNDFADELLKMITQVWKDKGLPPGLINKDVTAAFAKKIYAGVQTGYGLKIGAVDYSTPDFNMLAALQKNVWLFSAAKNYTQLRELSNALIGEDGKLRTFSQFKEAAFKINDTHVKQYLKAEYELAVAGGQMAGKWVAIENDKDNLPYLEFDAVLDKQTTTLCRELDGTLLPVDHTFWNQYYPPNHFGCRSTVRQKSGGLITAAANIPTADIPAMFRVNLAKERLVFPNGHNYYQDIPEGIQQAGLSAMRKELTQVAKERLHSKSIPVDGVGNVTFTNKSIKEMINQPHQQYILKNQYVTIADTLLRNAKIISTQKSGIKTFHYLSVAGLEENFILVVKEDEQGHKILYSIVDKIKEW